MGDELDIEYDKIEEELETKPAVIRFYSASTELGQTLLDYIQDEENGKVLSSKFCKSDIEGGTISIHAVEADILVLLYDEESFFNETDDFTFAAFALLNKFGKTLYVDIFCTSEASRIAKKRYGETMLKAIETYGKEKGYEAVELESLPTALEFYKKMGYTQTPEGMLMRKSLTTGGGRLRLKTLRRSHKKEKKWDAVFEQDGKQKVVPFGQHGYSDFTKHKDTARRQRYIERHARMGEDWKDPTTPGALSRYILWNKKTLRASLRDFKKKFHV